MPLLDGVFVDFIAASDDDEIDVLRHDIVEDIVDEIDAGFGIERTDEEGDGAIFEE